MISRTVPLSAAALLFALGTAGVVQAQARGAARPPAAAAPARAATPAAARPAAPPLTHGPAIAGVCVFSHDRAVATSSVGKAASARMEQLRAQAAAELTAERTGIQTEANTLQGQQASLTQEQRQQRGTALQTRADAFQRKAQQREQEFELTAAQQMRRIDTEIEPIARSLYQARNCSLLLNGDGAVMAANPAMDITEQVVAQLNTRLPTISFDRATLPAQGTAPAAPR